MAGRGEEGRQTSRSLTHSPLAAAAREGAGSLSARQSMEAEALAAAAALRSSVQRPGSR